MGTAADWMQNFPELSTRQDLIEFLLLDDNRSFRRSLFRRLNRLLQIPDIRCPHTATWCLTVAYRDARHSLIQNWQGRLDATHEGRIVFCQAVGVFRNLYRNMLAEINPARHQSFGPHDVIR